MDGQRLAGDKIIHTMHLKLPQTRRFPVSFSHRDQLIFTHARPAPRTLRPHVTSPPPLISSSRVYSCALGCPRLKSPLILLNPRTKTCFVHSWGQLSHLLTSLSFQQSRRNLGGSPGHSLLFYLTFRWTLTILFTFRRFLSRTYVEYFLFYFSVNKLLVFFLVIPELTKWVGSGNLHSPRIVVVVFFS